MWPSARTMSLKLVMTLKERVFKKIKSLTCCRLSNRVLEIFINNDCVMTRDYAMHNFSLFERCERVNYYDCFT